MNDLNFVKSDDQTLSNAEWTAASDIATLILFSVFESTQAPSPELIKAIAKVLKKPESQVVAC